MSPRSKRPHRRGSRRWANRPATGLNVINQTMLNLYQHKIRTPEEIKGIVGDRPRSKKVIMCHGTFDVIHPGHLRHLMYAKEKADVLVTSVTCDDFIAKGPHRPFVPEELRAANLSALEMVDLVIIDRNATPIKNILAVQPDFFAKGFEYIADGLHPNTREELDALETYGGELIFTPGDIVYSSSALLRLQAPNLSLEKLLVLMDSEGVTFSDLRQTLHSLSGLKVHVVGDTIVDKYTHCTLLGAASKSPTFSVKPERSECFLGGAAVVARHARTFGAKVALSTVMGNDDAKDLVLKELQDSDIEVLAEIDESRPTTVKERFVVDGHRVLQVDHLDNRIVSDRTVRAFCQDIESSASDVYIFSDFRHGIFHPGTVAPMTEAIGTGAFKAADSQVSSRWGNILDFPGFDLITPNEREARFALADQDSVIRPLATNLWARARCKWLILKLGERGVLCHRGPSLVPRDFFILDSFVESLVDPVGAGDSLLALSSLVLAQSGNFVIASILGNLAAAVACEREGNVPVAIAEMVAKLDTAERSANHT